MPLLCSNLYFLIIHLTNCSSHLKLLIYYQQRTLLRQCNGNNVYTCIIMSIFFEMGYPQPLHQSMHTASFIKRISVLQPSNMNIKRISVLLCLYIDVQPRFTLISLFLLPVWKISRSFCVCKRRRVQCNWGIFWSSNIGSPCIASQFPYCQYHLFVETLLIFNLVAPFGPCFVFGGAAWSLSL
jgi:hypothetical protein